MDGPAERSWRPDLHPPDNRPGGRVHPPWHLLADRPVPEEAVVVGTTDAAVEAWLVEVGASVRHVETLEDLPSRADLVIVGDTVAASVDRAGLGRLARCCGGTGSLWLPGRQTGRRDRSLRDHGFAVRRWTGPGRQARGSPRTGVLACTSGRPDRPPSWLAEIGRGAGWDPDRGRWSLSTPDAYPSQKTVARLRPGAPGAGPSFVVKVTQHPRFNDRLANEAVRLRELHGACGGHSSRAPRVLGTARVGGLTAVVEEGLDGRPFLDVSPLTAECPHASDGVAAITAVAQATGTVGPGRHLADVVGTLVDPFVARNRPSPRVEAFLRSQVEVLASAPRVPTVMFHGDLGTWNLMVVDGTVRILDWESAVMAGPPLWDLAYFLRSYAVRSGRRRGRGRDRAITRHLVEGSSLTTAFDRWMRHHCRVVGIDRELVAPLFHTCWMHRAVKEGARLRPDQQGHYGPLCTRLVEERDAPGLRRLLAG